jgi:predicted nucleotidyltransferase
MINQILLKKELLKKIVFKNIKIDPNVTSVTFVGSFITNNNINFISDVDVVVIVKKLDKKVFDKINNKIKFFNLVVVQVNLTNNYLKFGSVFPSGFPLLTEIPQHVHFFNDAGHAHQVWTEDQPFATFGATQYIKRNNEGNSNTGTAYTGLTLNSSGNKIQQIDPYSNISGVNVTQPFISINFIICVN